MTSLAKYFLSAYNMAYNFLLELRRFTYSHVNSDVLPILTCNFLLELRRFYLFSREISCLNSDVLPILT